MADIINLNKFLKLEEGLAKGKGAYEAQEQVIEEYKRLTAEGRRPQLLIGANNALHLYIETVYGEPDWSKELQIQIDFEDEGSIVRVLRSPDLKGLTLHLV